jgi:phosphoesterase RecJ-like protein
MRSRLSDEPNANSFMQLPLFLDRVKVVIFLKEEKKGVVKVSFRSPGEVDVNELASRFGGGGHQTAAGARVPKSLSKVSQEVLRVTQAYLGSGGS